MIPDSEICYRALAARDARFDGAFFVGVKTTGIYCRSVCPAKTPLARSCRFFALPAAAEAAGFRPCLRCCPEMAPGTPQRSFPDALLAHLQKNSAQNVKNFAKTSGISARQMRRLMRESFGVTPVQILQTERLLLAKKLLQETRLPIIEVGHAAGFRSLRRFNALFKKRYRLAPSHFRTSSDAPAREGGFLDLRLAYRPPYAWQEMLDFLRKRAIPGVERVEQNRYFRVVTLGDRTGVIQISFPATGAYLQLSLPPGLIGQMAGLIHQVRAVFDLDADPLTISGHLGQDLFLTKHLERHPGLRVPGAWSPFELAIRAILGQQISVVAATTLAGRLTSRFGKSIVTNQPALSHVFPTPEMLATADLSDLQAIGLPLVRARTLQGVAQAFASGELTFLPGTATAAIRAKLLALPGIGPWTADYILLRAWREPDAFPAGDLALQKAAGGLSERELSALAEPWRPWRAYATLHLWQSLRT